MKLYLSSYHLGDHAQELKSLVGVNKSAAVIFNALDFATDLERKQKSLERELDDLASLGLDPELLDLKLFFGHKAELAKKIEKFGMVWVIGGNCFILRRAMKYSGLDQLLQKGEFDENFVYAGYSAGVCVLSPTLKGLELVDDPYFIPEGYQSEIIWDGLNMINYSVAQHYKSDHPESAAVEKEVAYFEKNHMPYKTLRDGEVIIQT